MPGCANSRRGGCACCPRPLSSTRGAPRVLYHHVPQPPPNQVLLDPLGIATPSRGRALPSVGSDLESPRSPSLSSGRTPGSTAVSPEGRGAEGAGTIGVDNVFPVSGTRVDVMREDVGAAGSGRRGVRGPSVRPVFSAASEPAASLPVPSVGAPVFGTGSRFRLRGTGRRRRGCGCGCGCVETRISRANWPQEGE
jgi:hypothetical protein